MGEISIMDSDLVDAGSQADHIAAQLRLQPQNLDVLVDAQDEAASALVAGGHDLRDFLPATEEIGLGFRGGERPSGRSILRAYRDALQSDLCDRAADLHQKVSAVLNTGGAAVVGLLVAALGLPVVAAALLAPLAGAILAAGLTAYCSTLERV
jgi:hypothetical protein